MINPNNYNNNYNNNNDNNNNNNNNNRYTMKYNKDNKYNSNNITVTNKNNDKCSLIFIILLGIESKYRTASVEDNLKRWKEMLDYTEAVCQNDTLPLLLLFI